MTDAPSAGHAPREATDPSRHAPAFHEMLNELPALSYLPELDRVLAGTGAQPGSALPDRGAAPSTSTQPPADLRNARD